MSLHIPLIKSTEKLVNRGLLRILKKNALLVNTARGGIIDFESLLQLLENKEIQINFAFDVFPEEPINPQILQRLKKVKEEQPGIRMLLLPHNASADSNTRGMMNVILLENIIGIIESSEPQDLEKVKIIPEHKQQLYNKKWKINNYWNKKRDRM